MDRATPEYCGGERTESGKRRGAAATSGADSQDATSGIFAEAVQKLLGSRRFFGIMAGAAISIDGSNSSHGGGIAFAFFKAPIRRREAMNEQEFQGKLAELMGEISTLPATERQKLEQLADETQKRHERLRKTVSGLQESLDYLRLSIKYLVFDLEATKRENGYLRKMLEETTGGNE
jgi:hypothetical protein